MGRKTIEVLPLIAKINTMNALTLDTPEGRGQREALNILAESILMQTNNYVGFKYHDDQYLPACEQTRENVLREDADDTKRTYFVKE